MKLFGLCRRSNKDRRPGMFWRFLFAMFFASFIGTVLFIIAISLYQSHQLTRELSSQAFKSALDQELTTLASTLAPTYKDNKVCQAVMHSWALSSNALSILPEGGLNSLKNLSDSGRISLRLTNAQQEVCHYPTHTQPASDNTSFTFAKDYNSLTFTSSQLTGTTPTQLVLQLDLLQSTALLWETAKNGRWNILLFFIAFLNLCCALTLAPILVKRIKRAEIVARGWTEGNMHARINDARHDEFGHLVQSFNKLADSFVDVIKVKQELAAFEERHRLARDLHDTAKQRAFALNLQLTALGTLGTSNPPETKRLTASALSLVQHLQNDLSNVIKRLSASTITEIGMREVLRQEVDSLFDGSGVQWTIQISNEIDHRLRAAPHFSQQLLLIAIEACANVLKHSSAKTISVTVVQSGENYTLMIEDDGQGYDTMKADNTGWGGYILRGGGGGRPFG